MIRIQNRNMTCPLLKKWIVLPGLAIALLSGCESLMLQSLTEPEREILDFEVQGLRLGSPREILANYAEVSKMPGFTEEGLEKFDILNPSPQISMISAFFFDGKVRRLEIRYFDGPTARSLTRAGGWTGIRDYIIQKFGPPTETGTEVPVTASQPGLNPQFARFNGVWKFPNVRRQLNYIAMADGRGGVGVVTVEDTRPLPQPRRPVPVLSPAATGTAEDSAPGPAPSPPSRPDPGF